MFYTEKVSRYLHFKEVSITDIWGTESRWWFQPTTLMRSCLELWDLLTSTFKWVAKKPIHHSSTTVFLALKVALNTKWWARSCWHFSLYLSSSSPDIHFALLPMGQLSLTMLLFPMACPTPLTFKSQSEEVRHVLALLPFPRQENTSEAGFWT